MSFGGERAHLDIWVCGCISVLQLPWELELDLCTRFTGSSDEGGHNTVQYTTETSSQLVDLMACNNIMCSLILHGSQGKYMMY